MKESQKHAQERYYQKLKEQGYKRKTVIVHKDDIPTINRVVDTLRRRRQ